MSDHEAPRTIACRRRRDRAPRGNSGADGCRSAGTNSDSRSFRCRGAMCSSCRSTSRAAARRSLTEYAALRPLPQRIVRQVLGCGVVVGAPRARLAGSRRPAVRRRDAARPSAGAPRRTRVDVRVGVAPDPVVLHAGAAAVPARRHTGRVRQDRLGRRHERAGAHRVGRIRASVAARTTDVPCAARPRTRARGTDLELCITAPLPVRSERVPKAALPPVSPLREVAEIDGPLTRLRCASRRGGSRSCRTRQTLDGQARRVARRARTARARRSGSRSCASADGTATGSPGTWRTRPTGSTSGIGSTAGPVAPFGFDLLHFFFQEEFVRRRPAVARRVRARRASGPRTGFGESVSIPMSSTSLRLLHRLEIRLRAERAVQRGAEAEAGVRTRRHLHIARTRRILPNASEAVESGIDAPGRGRVTGGTRSSMQRAAGQAISTAARHRIPGADTGHAPRSCPRWGAQSRRQRGLRLRQLPSAAGSSRPSSEPMVRVSSSSRSPCSTSCPRSANSGPRPA